MTEGRIVSVSSDLLFLFAGAMTRPGWVARESLASADVPIQPQPTEDSAALPEQGWC